MARTRAPRDIKNAAEVRRLLAYDPVSGELRWKVGRPGSASAGTIAGTVSRDGYIKVSIYDKIHSAHRLIWLMQIGEWPDGLIDHANRDRTDNSWANLRISTARQNCQNRAVSPRCKTGRKGVTFRRETNRYRVLISVDGQKKHLGYFKDLELAALVYDEAAERFHGEFNYKGGAMDTSVVNDHRD